MDRKQCAKCLFNDKCGDSKICDNYYPVDGDMTDDAVDKMIYKRRGEFRREWAEYIERFYE